MLQAPRLAFIISTLDTGGAEIQLLNTLNALPRGLDVKVFVLRDRLELAAKLDNPDVRLEVVGLRARWDARAWRRLARGLREFRPDVIHSHMLLSNWAARALAPVCGLPRVVNHEHGLSTWKGAFLNGVDRFSQSLADKVVVVSRASMQARILNAGLDERRVVVMPNAIDWQRLSKIRRAPGNRRTWGIAARLTDIKRIDVALELLARSQTAGFDGQLLIAGDGPLRGELEALAARLGVAEATQFLGRVEDMASFYSQVDVVLLTSSSEDCPMTLLEALAAGRFVAATPVGGVPELLEGLRDTTLIDVEHLDATAARLSDVPAGFDSPENRSAAERFDIARYVRALFDVYQLPYPSAPTDRSGPAPLA